MHKSCDNPLCQIGGATKQAVKRGSADLAHAYRDALATSERRVAQGHAPITGVYLCASGNWHHATKANPTRVVVTLDGMVIGFDRNVTRATATLAVTAYVTRTTNGGN